eukprot:TRINITY_DN5576_c0_g2_i1.p1 TRINITY_DN5576_c0_g2~~TRINITY_DN5576_c0_g2_i1.p1  ORF type:complete len:189 (+),score=30.69 TRINITY_DN5576_c0_g2_i1:107-673(+)
MFRPWGEFFDGSGFSAPEGDTVRQRIVSNLVYFQGNYVIVLFLSVIYLCFSSALLFVLLPALLVGGVVLARRYHTLAVGTNTLSRSQALLAYFLFCVLLSWLFAGSILFVFLLLGLLVILLHSAFRNRPLVGKAATFMEAWKESSDKHATNSDDEENPPPRNHDQIRNEQQQFRAQFRAKMRQKYLRQ